MKLDLYGLNFIYTHVLQKTWADLKLIKAPKTVRIPDIVTTDEAQRLFIATNRLSYRVFFFTIYSLGLRLSEGLALEVDDIDAIRLRVLFSIPSIMTHSYDLAHCVPFAINTYSAYLTCLCHNFSIHVY